MMGDVFEWDEIVSLDEAGEEEVFDLSVAEDHSFVAGELVAHNCKDPAFQTIPKKTKWAKRLRECYPAPPGKKMMQVDFNQGELRVIACVAPEERMIEAYRQGMDLHSITAASMAGYELEEFLALEEADPILFSKLRTNGKAGNFGLCYGLSAPGFVDYAWASYGLKLTLEEAERMRHTFLFEQWTGLPAYHDRMKAFVRRHQHVRSPLGRVRHLPTIRSRDPYTRSTAERQAINAVIQSSLSDLMLLALTLIQRNLGDVVDIVGMIHDAGLFYVPEKDAEIWARRIVEVASDLPIAEYFDWHPPLDFPVDAELGPNLAHLKKLKF